MTSIEEDAALAAAMSEALEDRRTIHERMTAILAELPAIGKGQRNEQQNFMYRGHDDVLNALNPLLAKHGVYVVPVVMERVTAERTTGSGKTMYEVNLLVRYTFYGADGTSVTASAWGEGTDLGDKSTNKAMTMAFKNVLAQTFAVSTEEDFDADRTAPEETTRGRGTGGGHSRGGGSGGGSERREFDPGIDLAPGAIAVKTEEDATSVRQGLRDLNDSLPWPVIEEYLCMELWDKSYAGLDNPQRREFWTRLANAVIRANELAGSGDFPPVRLELIVQAFAWAFKGVTLALEEKKEEVQHEEPESPSE